jgi:hypothetical protein
MVAGLAEVIESEETLVAAVRLELMAFGPLKFRDSARKLSARFRLISCHERKRPDGASGLS